MNQLALIIVVLIVKMSMRELKRIAGAIKMRCFQQGSHIVYVVFSSTERKPAKYNL